MAAGNGGNKMLGRELGRVEYQYLRTQLTEDEAKKGELVQQVMEKFVLKELKGTFSGVAYTGSNYEFTAVPRKSDYDIQLYLKLPYFSPVVEASDDPAWVKVNGGPTDLLNSTGYLSTVKALRLIQSKIDKALQKDEKIKFKGNQVWITRSMHGPATTLNVSWRNVSLTIDIVVSLRAGDLRRSWYRSYYNDLVGKPYDSWSPDDECMWRISYSKQELEKSRNFHYYRERKLTLLRIMKVIKQHQSQLDHFPSYFYKNLLFKLDEVKPSVSWYYPSDLPERFKDMIKEMRDCLRAGVLPLHFNKEVNFLRNTSGHLMDETANYLDRIIGSSDYIQLLQRVPSTHKAVPESELQQYEESSWRCHIM